MPVCLIQGHHSADIPEAGMDAGDACKRQGKTSRCEIRALIEKAVPFKQKLTRHLGQHIAYLEAAYCWVSIK